MPEKSFYDPSAAIEYIRKKGYASYSSLKMVRDGSIPEKVDASYFTFGTELHSRVLEYKKLLTLSKDEELLLSGMVSAIQKNPISKIIFYGGDSEVKFHQRLFGFPVLGYIDKVQPQYIADLKSTRCTSMNAFVESMDFLQPALYRWVTGKDFIYVGVSKSFPVKVFIFDVKQYPYRMLQAERDLFRVISMLNENIRENKTVNKKQKSTDKTVGKKRSNSKKRKGA